MAIYGDYLFTESNFKEAGLALDSYKNCGSWREAFAIAQELNSSSDSLFSLAKSLADLIETNIKPSVIEGITNYTLFTIFHRIKNIAYAMTFNIGHTQLLQDVNSMLDQLNHQTKRLKEIRANKANQLNQSEESIENADVFSDTSSMASGFTRYSQSNTQLIPFVLITINMSFRTNVYSKSAKSRRRQERKKARGKKGSIYEEGYLLDSLKRLIERFNTTQAQQIQVLFSDLEERIKNDLDEIFDTPTNNLPAFE
ncbi:11715_t:CDS:2, partial [Racocetra fulgida]